MSRRTLAFHPPRRLLPPDAAALERVAGLNRQVKRRQLWLAVHRYLGLFTFVFLGLAAATGIVLSFDKPLDAWLNPELFAARDASPINPEAAVAAFARAHPGVRVLSFPLAVLRGHTLLATVAPRPGTPPPGYDQVFLDGDDGHVAGTRKSRPGVDRAHLMLAFYQFHYTLLAGTAGRWLMGLVALGWLIGNLVGAYLTLPLGGGAFRRLWGKAWRFRWRDPLLRLMHDMHRATGLWAMIGITIISFTSVSMNFFGEVFTPAVEAISPAAPSPFDRPAMPRAGSSKVDPAAAVAAARREARRLGLHWHPAKIEYDADYGLYRILFTDDGFENYHGLGPRSLYIDGRTGRLAYVDDPYADSAGRRLSRALYPLHTGQVGGWFGVAVVVALGVITVEMCGSGAYLWWKRRRGRIAGEHARRRRATAAAAR